MECLRAGGSYERAGMAQQFMCIKKFADAFQECTSNRQCQGGCILDDGVNLLGYCRPQKILFGCLENTDNS